MYGTFLAATGIAKTMSGKLKVRRQRPWLQRLVFGVMFLIGLVCIVACYVSHDVGWFAAGILLCASSSYLLSILAGGQSAKNL